MIDHANGCVWLFGFSWIDELEFKNSFTIGGDERACSDALLELYNSLDGILTFDTFFYHTMDDDRIYISFWIVTQFVIRIQARIEDMRVLWKQLVHAATAVESLWCQWRILGYITDQNFRF